MTGNTVRLYGEIFGGGIQKGVNYGIEKRIRYFAMQISEQWVSFEYMDEYFASKGAAHILVPVVATVSGLGTALNLVDVETLHTALGPDGAGNQLRKTDCNVAKGDAQ